MKTILFENIRNKEKFVCPNARDVVEIEGVEYIRVLKYGTQRDCLVRRDQLKKVSKFQ